MWLGVMIEMRTGTVPEDEYEYESDLEVEEDELVGYDHEAEEVPHVEYDKDNPPMTGGSTYPSMEQFKLALSQHAIKHEFECNTTIVHHAGLGPIVQGKSKISVRGGYMLL